LFDLLLLPPARRFLESLEGADLREVQRLLDIIAQDPFWDNETKVPFPVPPAIVSIYDNGRFRIIYHLLNSHVIRIWAIGRSGTNPNIFERTR